MDDLGASNLSAEDLDRIYGRAEEAEAAGDAEQAARLREQATQAQERAERAEARAEQAAAREAREEARAEKLDRQAEQAERLGNEERAERIERMAERAETRAERAEERADAAQEQAAAARAEADAATAQAEGAPFDPMVTTTAEDLLGDQAGLDPVGPDLPGLEDLMDIGIAGNIEEIREALDDAPPLGGADGTLPPDGGPLVDPPGTIIEDEPLLITDPVPPGDGFDFADLLDDGPIVLSTVAETPDLLGEAEVPDIQFGDDAIYDVDPTVEEVETLEPSPEAGETDLRELAEAAADEAPDWSGPPPEAMF